MLGRPPAPVGGHKIINFAVNFFKKFLMERLGCTDGLILGGFHYLEPRGVLHCNSLQIKFGFKTLYFFFKKKINMVIWCNMGHFTHQDLFNV